MKGDLPGRHEFWEGRVKTKFEDKWYWQKQPLMTSAQGCEDDRNSQQKRLVIYRTHARRDQADGRDVIISHSGLPIRAGDCLFKTNVRAE